MEIIDKLQKEKETDFFRTNEKGQQLVYDRQAVLFSILELKVDPNVRIFIKKMNLQNIRDFEMRNSFLNLKDEPGGNFIQLFERGDSLFGR